MTEEDLIREYLEYDPETGDLFWKVTRGKRGVKGKKAGCKTSDGYVHVTLAGKTYMAHRLAWFIYYEKWPNKYLDHKDGIKSNNKINNLREASNSENCRNKPKKGYYWDDSRKKFCATIMVNYKKSHLGYFDTEEEARKAHVEAMEKYHGEFANYNLPK